jgi:3',5'-cyclic-AMP phosphodiesterase
MLIAQITDCHIRLEGDLIYGVVDPALYLKRAVDRLIALDPRPDLVIVSGDLVDAGSPAEYARLRALLAPLPMPVRLIAGNHDLRASLRASFPDHAYLQGESEFLHYVDDSFPLRLVGLDSVTPGQVGGSMCAARLDWLDKRLAEAPARPTLIVVHHPPVWTGIAHMDALPFQNAEGFAAVVSQHKQVERVIAGHLHRSVSVRWAGTVVSVCPSTAHQFALDLQPPDFPARYVLEPPGFQLHRWIPGQGITTHTGVIGDYAPTPLH